MENNHTLEEKLNSLTHSIGAGMSIVGLVFLLIWTGLNEGTTTHYVAFALYGAFQILLYLSSGLTHLFTDRPKVHSVLRLLDQAAVFLLIAGTYTPISLLALRGAWGWSIFGVIWGMAILGILFKVLFARKKHLLSDLFYLPMGWTIIVAIKPLIAVAPKGLLLWTCISGGCYTIGVIFYIAKRIPMGHVLWHLFVLAGSIGFYIGFIQYLI